LQDTDSGTEIIHMAENGFCADGEQEQWIAEGRTRLSGALPVNTDGGCLACGEPIGASGLRQVYENFVQLSGRAGARQVQNDPRIGYSHVYGAPGISGVAILER
jgi:acetyl-CoA acetyltransferase